MNELRACYFGIFFSVCLLVSSSGEVDAAESYQTKEDGALLMVEYLHSMKVQVESNQTSGCIRTRRRELGETWCVNCHAGANPDQFEKLFR